VRAGWRLSLLVGLSGAIASGALAEEKPPFAILDGSGAWRALHSWNAPLVETPQGLQERRSRSDRGSPTERPDFHFMTAYPPPGWVEPDFDDSGWARRHYLARYANGECDVRAGGGSGSPYLRQLSLRGKFAVTEPAKVGQLSLTMAFRGGAIVYVNGKEVARAHLPAGRVEPGTPAETCPLKAYLKDNGKPWHWWDDHKAISAEAYPLRVRKLEKLAVPAHLLRRGTNLLAVELHAAPWPEAFTKAEPPWGTCGLIELHLQADKADGIAPNVARPRGVQVWNTSIAEQVLDVSWGDPHEPLKPVSMAGPRNGCCSGRVVVSSDEPMKGLRATMSEMTGPGGAKLPASAVRICYGRFDPPRGSRWGGVTDSSELQWDHLPSLRDDALLESPPAEAPVSVKQLRADYAQARRADGLLPKPPDGALQPVWLTVEIPKDAPPGDYRGSLAIALDGVAQPPAAVSIELKVIDWALPDPADYVFWMGMVQSPEAVALTYGAPLWSDRHCELVAKSLEWIGKLGGKVLYIPLGAESQYGNEQSLALWVKGADGKLTHDLSRVEKYLDLALKHMGKPSFVVVGVWDSCMHVSAPTALRRNFPRFSVLDPKTGETKTTDGPKHGSPESLEFWQPALTKMREVLARRGLAEAMLLGYCADHQPDKATVGVFRQILPDVSWQATRHPPRENDKLPYEGGTVPIRYQANVWGGWDNSDPDTRRAYGWTGAHCRQWAPANPSLRTWLDRGLFDACPIVQFRTACEQALLADRRGLGQIGADFWPVKGPDGKPTHTMVGRFPATSEGNLGIYSGQLLYPGPDGPVPTARYQMMRENIQECEARIFLEKLLTEQPSRLPADLARRLQDLLDERTRWHRLLDPEHCPESSISWPASGWEARRLRLFEAAAEAAKAIVGR
jgi:hypothetical protein